MIDSTHVGVKLPASGSPESVGVGVAEGVIAGLGVKVGVGDGVGLGEVVGLDVGLDVGVAEGVDSNAGPSAAWTMKFLVMVRNIPFSSLQESVNLCTPSSSSDGGLQFHFPPEPIVISSVISSDSTVIVTSAPAGPSPKNSGFVEVTTSPSSRLSRVTAFVVADSEFSSDTSNLDSLVSSWGSSTSAEVISSFFIVSVFLKSCASPIIIIGVGLAPSGYTFAVEES